MNPVPRWLLLPTKTMQDYINVRYQSRGIEIWEEPLPCEFCLLECVEWTSKWVNPIDDIHHILPGAKTRQYSRDGKDLIGCCRMHHISQTNNNGWLSVDKCLAIAKESINIFRRMKCKEKLWRLVELLSLKQWLWQTKNQRNN